MKRVNNHLYDSFRSDFNERYSLVTRKMLRALSENSRITVSELAQMLKLSRKTTKERLMKLEKELGIRYTIELDEDKLGLANPHIIAVKFDKKPDLDYLKQVFARSYIPQLVVAIKGNYDLLIFANTQTRDEYIHWDKSMQIFLAEYGVSWYPSEVGHRQLGFYPLRNELLDRVELPPKYKNMIKLLNVNGRASFQELSKKMGMHFNTVAYNFRKLMGMKYIKRFTLVMDKPEWLTFVALFGKYTISETFEQDARDTRIFFKDDDENSLVSRYIVVNQLVGSNDLVGIGAFDNLEVARERFVSYYRRAMTPEKPRIAYGTVERILLGHLPIRSLETRKEYRTLVWSPDFERQATSEHSF